MTLIFLSQSWLFIFLDMLISIVKCHMKNYKHKSIIEKKKKNKKIFQRIYLFYSRDVFSEYYFLWLFQVSHNILLLPLYRRHLFFFILFYSLFSWQCNSVWGEIKVKPICLDSSKFILFFFLFKSKHFKYIPKIFQSNPCFFAYSYTIYVHIL